MFNYKVVYPALVNFQAEKMTESTFLADKHGQDQAREFALDLYRTVTRNVLPEHQRHIKLLVQEVSDWEEVK